MHTRAQRFIVEPIPMGATNSQRKRADGAVMPPRGSAIADPSTRENKTKNIVAGWAVIDVMTWEIPIRKTWVLDNSLFVISRKLMIDCSCEFTSCIEALSLGRQLS